MLNEEKFQFLSGKKLFTIVILILGFVSFTNAQGITMTLGGNTANDKFIVENSDSEAGLVVTGEGKVGIGTTNPTADLHVTGENGVLFSGDYGSGTIPVSGKGTRMMWRPKKAAFRAGYVDGTQWDDASIGMLSIAMGDGTIASGFVSTAIGNHTTASGNFSTAMGIGTTASGYASTAMGNFTVAQSLMSLAIGGYNVGGGNATGWIDTDPIFEIGISTDPVRPVNAMTVLKNGNVGIGTTNPVTKLDVRSPSGSGNNLRLYSGTVATHSFYNSNGDNARTVMRDANGDIKIALRTDRESYFNGGNVGIGTTNPQGKLDVNGSIYQRGGQLHADYVFEDDYELESIKEHADYMWTEKHLKAIPHAMIDENGLEIVEVGSHRKGIVEELEKAHIYIEQLHQFNTALEKRLAKLEQLMIEKGE